MKKFILIAVLAAAGVLAAEKPLSFTADLNRILSRLQSMANESRTAAEWTAIRNDITGIEQRARDGEAWDSFIQARVIHAMVLGDMQRKPQDAVDLLKLTRRELEGKNVPDLKKVFVSLAGFQGKLGDEAAVAKTMEEFKASPYYDPQDYAATGGSRPGDPIVVQRPNAGASASISETAMKVAQTQSRFGIGALFPDYDLKDAAGNAITKQSLAGKLVLFDFWNKDWAAWKTDLPTLVRLRERFAAQGFEIVGLNLDPNAGDISAFARANKMTWSQATDSRTLARQLGLYGDCGNVLVDRDGVIIGRNLRGAELNEAVKKALSN